MLWPSSADVGGSHTLVPPLSTEGRSFSPNDMPQFQHWELEVCAIIEVVRRKHSALAPTWDVMRRHIESLAPAVYAATAYYEKWALGFFLALFESELPVSRADLAKQLGVVPGPQGVEYKASSAESSFKVGDDVQVAREDTATFWLRPHLRTPGYIFGKRGVVERVCGQFPSPELLAFGIKGEATTLYRVRFVQQDLWSEYEGGPADTIDVELYEPWLRAPATEMKAADGGAAAASVHTQSQADAHADAHDGDAAHADAGHPAGERGHGHAHEARAELEQAAVDIEPPPGPYRRVAEALKTILVEKGLVRMNEIMAEIEAQDMNHKTHEAGSRVVVRAWRDAQFRGRLLADGKATVRQEYGIDLDCGQLVVVENSTSVHNLVVCTLCSCYPGALLGKPPDWYKSRSFRSRAVFEPRRVLAEFGVELDVQTTLRVHDSTADMRYLVIPALPDGASADESEEALVALVTRDSMIGAGVARAPPDAGSSSSRPLGTQQSADTTGALKRRKLDQVGTLGAP